MRTWIFIFIFVGLGILYHVYFRRMKERRDPPPHGRKNPVQQWLTGRDDPDDEDDNDDDKNDG